MKVSKLAVLFTIAILTTSTSAITVNAAGRTAASIPNTILNGKGAPTNAVGINGDFYIDTRSLLIYGPKAKGKWPLPQNLQGPTGATGSNGTSGSDGKNGSDGKTTAASTVSGAPGTPGATGAPGAPGANGTPGTPGATGSPGAPGSGSPGATGSPGSNGSPGAPGTAGAKGETGTAGSVGNKGETGTAGINGITKVISGIFTIGDISGITGSSSTGSLTGFKATKSYVVRFNIFAYQPDDSGIYFLPMSLTFTATGGSPTVTANYSLAQGSSYRTGSPRYENSFIADVVIDGSAVVTDFGLTLTFVAGRSTASTELVRFVGSFVAMEVNSVTGAF
jgi:hypothetical protein